MTTFQVYIDGWPFLVEFEGTIEIARTWDGETVAIRGGPVKSVRLDHLEVDLCHARCRQLQEDKADFMQHLLRSLRGIDEFWHDGTRSYWGVSREGWQSFRKE